ncbi:hypothetical protein GCM10022224_030590 [Nonomuraea antimicrobica]|uniref:Uncharacterized protein n=1 Tax=Nonomuraea antimicrobica TaxID=561173 RepID=A0ABP7BLH6_9ACTN
MSTRTYPYEGEYAERLKALGRTGSLIGDHFGGLMHAVWRVLYHRGIELSDEVFERLLSSGDMWTLDVLLRRALVVESEDELFAEPFGHELRTPS